ncbi:hypothetical protein OHB56_40285 [Streptomyces sp. NBC_01635]|uniref:hypothetical protein n=1 Tax=Streptomyces sp. NBC_01635 TaxID=2975904 RepID=UPI00386FE3D6|nr:hypothetical protein OHB56_40285 [Streptomyces sp. NBC_01635]
MAEDALLAIVDEAVPAQPVADRVVAARGRPGPVSGAVTQTGGEQISVYHRLNARLSRLFIDDGFDELGKRAFWLLSCHQRILHQAVNFACATHPDPRAEAALSRG